MTIHEFMRPIMCLKISDYKQVVIIKEVTIRKFFNVLRVETKHLFINMWLYADCDYNRGDYKWILL